MRQAHPFSIGGRWCGVILCVTAFWCGVLPADEAPANRWQRIATADRDAPAWSAIVFAPCRGQVLHWGRPGDRGELRDDVRALDASGGRWAPDYPATPAAELRKAMGEALGIRVWGRGAKLENGRPAASWVVHGVTYDSKRKRLIYVMKGLMAAYDPATRAWSEIKCRTEWPGPYSPCPDMPYGMYERGLAPERVPEGGVLDGPPPVYGPGICYDAVNDEVLLFPHWGSQNTDRRGKTGEVSSHTGTWAYSCERSVWRRLNATLKQEPDARCGAPMVLDERNKAIVLFGGQDALVRSDLAHPGRAPRPGRLNDTWAYDLRTRQWRELTGERRPPARSSPLPAWDSVSGLVLLVALSDEDQKKPTATLWSLDLAKGEWLKRSEQPWEGPVPRWASMAIDAPRRLLVLACDTQAGLETWRMKLDLEKLPGEPAPVHVEPSAPHPQTVPADDPAWVERLRKLPPNVWVQADPPREPSRRDWGMMTAAPVTGLVFYFGGGHSTYQVNDVAVYAIGANRWVHAAGESNFPVPPHDWDGCTMSFRGGPPAGHQRNSYAAVGGQMYVHAGTHSCRWDAEIATQPGRRVAWFYDLTAGGLWRQREIDVELGGGVPGSYGRLHMAGADGCIYGFAGHLEPYDGRFFKDEAYFSTFDVKQNKLSVVKIPAPTPGSVLECRPFCLLGDRRQVLFYEYRKGGPHATWLYDIESNRFRDLRPRRQPPREPLAIEYIQGQDAVIAAIAPGELWVYSLKANDWRPLELRVQTADGKQTKMRIQDPYAQMVYVPRYGVLVNFSGTATYVMRPALK